jgi:hypothetical protein
MNCPKCGDEFLYETLDYGQESKHWLCGSRLAYLYTAGRKTGEKFIQDGWCRAAELEKEVSRLHEENQQLREKLNERIF